MYLCWITNKLSHLCDKKAFPRNTFDSDMECVSAKRHPEIPDHFPKKYEDEKCICQSACTTGVVIRRNYVCNTSRTMHSYL